MLAFREWEQSFSKKRHVIKEQSKRCDLSKTVKIFKDFENRDHELTQTDFFWCQNKATRQHENLELSNNATQVHPILDALEFWTFVCGASKNLEFVLTKQLDLRHSEKIEINERAAQRNN